MITQAKENGQQPPQDLPSVDPVADIPADRLSPDQQHMPRSMADELEGSGFTVKGSSDA